MRSLHLLAVSAVVAALPVFAIAAQPSVFGPRNPPPRHHHHGGGMHGGHHRFGGGIWIVEREVPVIVERVVEVPVAVPVRAAPPPDPRKPYVVGRHYASLPGGCMKLIEGGASYYYCGGGEWYRQVGKQYRAVARP